MMDTGVGSTIFMSGFSTTLGRSKAGRQWNAKHAALRIGCMLLLGGARPVGVAALGLKVPIDEYGAHWNFFLTLAVVFAVAEVLKAVRVPPAFLLPLGICGALVYDLSLSRLGVTQWLETAPRTTLFEANREGILGSIGGVLLYVVSAGVGHVVGRLRGPAGYLWMAVAVALSAAISLGLQLCDIWPSRTAINLSFICNEIIFVAVIVFFFEVCWDVYTSVSNREGGTTESQISDGYGQQVLLCFLACNVANGLTKAAVPLLLLPRLPALALTWWSVGASSAAAYGFYRPPRQLKSD
eukprot:Polyplicarium_translucidae@DN2647_c0_g1_i1.p1